MKITTDIHICIELTGEELTALKELLRAVEPPAISHHGLAAERLRVDLLLSLPSGA